MARAQSSKTLGKADKLLVPAETENTRGATPVVTKELLDRKQLEKSLKRKPIGPKKKATPKAKKVAATKRALAPQTEVKKL